MAWSLEARGAIRHVRGRRSNVGVWQAAVVASVDVFGDIETGRGGRAGWEGRPRPQPTDKPRTKFEIPGCAPWILVYTKYGRRFAYNPDKNASFWRIPDKLKAGILELDQARIREKVGGKKEKDSEKQETEKEDKDNK